MAEPITKEDLILAEENGYVKLMNVEFRKKRQDTSYETAKETLDRIQKKVTALI